MQPAFGRAGAPQASCGGSLGCACRGRAPPCCCRCRPAAFCGCCAAAPAAPPCCACCRCACPPHRHADPCCCCHDAGPCCCHDADHTEHACRACRHSGRCRCRTLHPCCCHACHLCCCHTCRPLSCPSQTPWQHCCCGAAHSLCRPCCCLAGPPWSCCGAPAHAQSHLCHVHCRPCGRAARAPCCCGPACCAPRAPCCCACCRARRSLGCCACAEGRSLGCLAWAYCHSLGCLGAAGEAPGLQLQVACAEGFAGRCVRLAGEISGAGMMWADDRDGSVAGGLGASWRDGWSMVAQASTSRRFQAGSSSAVAAVSGGVLAVREQVWYGKRIGRVG